MQFRELACSFTQLKNRLSSSQELCSDCYLSLTSGYGYANFLYVAFFGGCLGEELKVDKGIVSYLIRFP